MIIRGIKAENVLKYRLLDIPDLPASGLIGISGANESGKSSIGEAICFALFGRTFSLAPKDIGKIIRWGEQRCSVWLRLSVKGKDYEIARFLDRDGNHSARLTDLGEREAPLARGVAAVTNALKEVLGYDFEEFIESFYLAQREITAPHPHSYAVKMMAGVAPLETCLGEVKGEVAREQLAVEGLEAKLRDVDEQIADLGLDQGHLEALERERRGVLERELEWLSQVKGLREAGVNYPVRREEWQAMAGRRGTAGLMRFLFVLVGLLLGGAVAILMFLPETEPAQMMRGWIGLNSGEAVDGNILIAGVAAAGVALLIGVVGWYRAAALTTDMKTLAARNEELTIRLEELDELPAELGNNRSAGDTETAGESTPGSAAVQPDPEARAKLRQRVAGMEATPEEVQQIVDREAGWLQTAAEAQRREREMLERQIEEERHRIDRYNKLTGMREGFAGQIDEHRHRIAVRQVSEQLLLRASRQASQRFNHDLRGLVSHTLPLFTEGHYEHLQIDDDLDVRVFSSEKQDFMELDEISSGTQRQIMLALRLSLSQQLIDRVIRDSQFVFLDEPFAFFDERRTLSSLAVLPKLSKDIRQIWVVAQQFPEAVAFDLRILCERERNTLEGSPA